MGSHGPYSFVSADIHAISSSRDRCLSYSNSEPAPLVQPALDFSYDLQKALFIVIKPHTKSYCFWPACGWCAPIGPVPA